MNRSPLSRRSHQRRILLRIEFIADNRDLCGRAFRGKDIGHKDWKRPAGRELIDKIRKALPYKCTTGSGDIFWTNYCLWRWLKERKLL